MTTCLVALVAENVKSCFGINKQSKTWLANSDEWRLQLSTRPAPQDGFSTHPIRLVHYHRTVRACVQTASNSAFSRLNRRDQLGATVANLKTRFSFQR